MLTFFIATTVFLVLVLIRTTYMKNRRINLMGRVQDNLLAVIGDNVEYKKMIDKYFLYMEHTLPNNDFEILMKEMCVNLNINPMYDHRGLMSLHTIREIISYNARYAKQMNMTIRETIEQDDNS